MNVPGPKVEQLVRGVTPVPHEPGRYRVRSRSGDYEHLVDLFENSFYGQCDCMAFTRNYGPKLAGGIPLDNSLQCFHIKQARRHFTETMLRMIWAELNSKPARVMPPRREYQLDRDKTYG